MTVHNKQAKDVLLYGKHPVSLALSNPCRAVREIYATPGAADELTIPANVPVRSATREQLEQMVGRGAVHQGVVARCLPLSGNTIEDVIASTKSREKAVVVLLDQVTDPHNIGAILRSAVAFNAVAVIVPEAGAPDETGVLAKSASGALELIPFVRVSNLSRAMDKLKKNDFWCVGLDGYAQKSIFEDKLPAKCAIVMGSEGDGLRRLTAENCDYSVKLPMNEKIESLNVSNACAITLYEWSRQHT